MAPTNQHKKKAKFVVSAPQACLARAQQAQGNGDLHFQLRQAGGRSDRGVVAAFASLTLSAAAADAVSSERGLLVSRSSMQQAAAPASHASSEP